MELTIDKTNQIKVLEDFFHSLSTADKRKIFTAGYKKAAKPLISAAKALVPSTGETQKSIGSLMVPAENAILVGARMYGINKGWKAHWLESGTVNRFRKSGGATGSIKASHFMEEAYNATEDQVFGAIEHEWYKAIDRFITATNKRLK